MNYTEDYIFRCLLNSTSGSPFSLKRNYNLLTIRNLSWGFFKHGETDILTVLDDYSLIEGEIKCSYRDFLNDFKKSPEIFEERKKKLYQKYYIMPKEIYREHENEIFKKLCELKCGLVTIHGNQPEVIYTAPILSDYTIDLLKFQKLVKLVCYRQNNFYNTDELIYKEID